jgi:sugar-specific transcriptional regulator TrmB
MSAEEREEEIEAMLKKLEKDSKNLKGKLKDDESRARSRIANQVEITELTIDSFRLEFARVDAVLKGKSKEFNSRLDSIKS